jgi:CubicO group peptidase (beta-lactamase class C family)
MGSAIPRGELAEIVRAARARTGVPAVAAGLLDGEGVELAADGGATVETSFRVASVTKWFTASLAALCLDLDEPLVRGASARALLSHTAGLRPESAEPLPEACRGLWSYSNAGYWAVGEACAAACGVAFAEAVRERLLEPLGMRASGFAEPARPARGHVQQGETGHRVVERDAYPTSRHPSGGLWSTVGDLLRFAEHQLGGPGPLSDARRARVREPQVDALGARYALGCWSRSLAGGRAAFDHEGSVGGYQSLLLVLPDDGAALAVLTNSWRGSGLIRRVVRDLGLLPASNTLLQGEGGSAEAGRYALDDTEATLEPDGDGFRVAETEIDPVTGARMTRPPFPAEALGGGVYGFAGGLLMSHRLDFPRPGVARVGWVALPREET